MGDFSLFSFYFTLIFSKFSSRKKYDFCNWKYIGLAQKFMHVFQTRMNFRANPVSITFSWEGEVRAVLSVTASRGRPVPVWARQWPPHVGPSTRSLWAQRNRKEGERFQPEPERKQS